MRFYLLVLAILTACGEPTAPQDVTDMFVRPVRDARPVRVDMRPINDAALRNDMGLPTGSRDESRSTFFPVSMSPMAPVRMSLTTVVKQPKLIRCRRMAAHFVSHHTLPPMMVV